MVEHPDQKQLGEERVHFILQLVHHPGKSGEGLKQGKSLKVGTDVETMEGCCLLARSLWLAQPVFLYTPGPV